MKKFEILKTLIVVSLIYFVMFFFFKGLSTNFDLSWTGNTGTLGDTFGGLLSPVIGLFSIYYIYRTFEIQNKQLEDQQKANRVTSSSYSLSTLLNALEEITNKFVSIEYKQYRGAIGPFRGKEALYEFYNLRKDDFVKNYDEKTDNDVLNSIVRIVEETRFVYEMFVVIRTEMLAVDAAFFAKKYKDVVRTFIEPIDMTFVLIGNSLKQHAAQQNEGDQAWNPRNLRILFSAYDTYERNMRILEKNKLLKEVDKGFTTDEYLVGNDLGINADLDKIKNYKENMGFTIL